MRLGRLEQAVEHAKQLINDFPEAAAGYMLVGDVRMERRHFSDALPSYMKALEIGNNSEQALRLHIAQRYNDDNVKAEATLTNWLAKTPNDLAVKNALAEFYLSTANFKAATGIYRELITSRNVPPALYNNLAFALYKQRKMDEAINYARKAYELAPTDPMVNDTLGWLLVENASPSEGLPFLREAVTRASGNPEIRYHLAAALSKLGRNKEAHTELKRVIEPNLSFEVGSGQVKLRKRIF